MLPEHDGSTLETFDADFLALSRPCAGSGGSWGEMVWAVFLVVLFFGVAVKL